MLKKFALHFLFLMIPDILLFPSSSLHEIFIIFRDDPPVGAIEEPGGYCKYGEDGEPVCVEFLNASVRKLIRSGEVSVTLQTEGTR